MALHMDKFSPFICELQDLESADPYNIKKREIIAPFDLRYYYSKLIQWRPTFSERLLNFEKSELRFKKLKAKVSYNDV